ncbi:unnamed protein product [Coffea canephora]|uniref:DH200=94 genomic scaffold, scaffold_1056 n=1 Tax=Coffea canephora TaxID=49390 RepID=A0A068VI75_COFCA|nr:unnamed protein product [Coffea canephora]
MEIPFNFITFFIFLALILTLWKRWKKPRKVNATQKLPPGPRKLPFIGNLHNLLGSLPHQALTNLAKKHGDLMHLQLGEVSAIVVSSPRSAKEILKTHDLAFADRPEVLVGKIICYDYSSIAFCPYGEYWRQMRKICTLELLSAKMVRSFGSIRQDEVLHLLSSIRASTGGGKPINLTEEVSSFTSSMVCRSAFGKMFGEKNTILIQLVKEVLSRTSGFDISDLFPSQKILHHLSWMKPTLLKVHHKIDVILDNIINEHIRNLARGKGGNGESGQEDLIDILLRIKESGGDLRFPITNKIVKAIMFDMFTAATETSATVVEWAMSEMIRNPDVMSKAQNEIRKAFMGKAKIEEMDIEGLIYLKSVIKETLRLHPPLPLLVPMECREQRVLDGYVIPIKTRVLVNAWAIHRDPKYWDYPESFKPERFDNNPVDFTGTHFHYLPFGGGRRICPGISFGLANVELPLAQLLYNFDWKLPPGKDGLDMTEAFGITVARKSNLHLVATMYDPSN